MAEQESLYLQALDNLELYSDKIREIFLEHAGEDGIVDMNRISDLMNELNSIIGIDLDKAKNFFSKSNSAIPDSFNLDATTFDDFIGLLKIWIERKSGKRGKPSKEGDSDKTASLEEIPTVESNQGTERVPKVTKKKKKSMEEDDVSQGKGRKNSQGKKGVNRNMIIPPQSYKKNRERLDELLLKHREDYHQKFYERQDEETEKISSIDFFIFLQDCFSVDTIQLKEKASNEHDFFQSQSSFETLMKIAESYFLHVREVNPEEFEIKNVALTFNECFDILDHWFQTDDNVVLMYEHEKFASNQTSNSAQSEVKKVLLDTIAKYKVMIEEANTEVEKMVLQGTVDTLYEKLKQLDGDDNDEEKRRLQQKQNKRREEKKIKALKEIFEFYAKQQLNGVKPVTFANLEKQFRTISMGKFSVILKNFKMKIDNFKLREMYKKIAVSDDLNFEEFYDLLQKVSREVELVKELKVIKPNPDIMKEYKPDSYKKSLSMKENLKAEQQAKRGGLNSRKNEADKLEEMWEHMGLYDGSYRSNMQQVQLAFNSQEKESFRIDPESIKNKSKKLHYEEKITEEIKEDIAKRNRLREVIKDVKRVEKTALNNYRAPAKQESYFNLPKPDSYAQQAKKEKVIPLLEKKMTLKDVGNSKYSEMRDRGFDPKFNPQDLIEENDEEDNYYLAEYNLTVALAKPQQIVPQSQKELPRDDVESYKATEMTRSKSTKRQSMAVDGRYSRMYESKATRVGTTSPQPSTTGVVKGRSKPSTSDENEYTRHLPSQSGISLGSVNRSVVHISQSTKNLLPNPSNSNMRNYGHIYESQFEVHNRPQYQVQRPEKIGNVEGNKKVGSGVMDRLSKIEQNSKKREYEIMTNLINIQNNKLEQGLRVARK